MEQVAVPMEMNIGLSIVGDQKQTADHSYATNTRYSLIIHHKPYNKAKTQKMYHLCKTGLMQKICDFCKLLIVFIAGLSIIAAVLYSAAYIFIEIKNIQNYSNSLNFKGECIVINRTKHHNEGKSGTMNTDGTPDYWTDMYQIKIYNNSLCTQYDEKQDTLWSADWSSGTAKLDPYSFEIGDIVTCYSNEECGDVAMDRGIFETKQTKQTGALYIAGVIIVICGTCCCCYFCYISLVTFCYFVHKEDVFEVLTWCLCLNLKNPQDIEGDWNEYISFKTGKHKELYHMKQWKHVLSASQRIDYFVSHCFREFSLTYNHGIKQIIVQYMDDTSND
eukprot:352498_1